MGGGREREGRGRGLIREMYFSVLVCQCVFFALCCSR